jgi:hypothetical protein
MKKRGVNMIIRQNLKLGFLVLCLFGILNAGKPYLIYNTGAKYTEAMVENIKMNIPYIDSLPFDGIAIHAVAFNDYGFSSKRVYTSNEILNALTPLSGKFKNMKHFFLQMWVRKTCDFFDDAGWAVILNNWRMAARALKAAGPEFKGILFDNEEYFGAEYNIWIYPDNVDHPEKSLNEYIAQVRLRGKQVMQACLAEYPEIKIMHLHGPYMSERGVPSTVNTQIGYRALAGPFFTGMVEAQTGLSSVIDGGENYKFRTVLDFETSYQWRKYTIASSSWNSVNIPVSLRPLWPGKVSISFGVDDNTGAQPTKTPAILKTTLENAMNRCDEYVWFYSENNAPANAYTYLEKGGVPAEWLKAVSDAYYGSQKGIRFRSVSEVFVSVNGPLGYKVKTDNYTSSPISYSFPKKPAWVITTSDSAYGIAPGAPGVDTLMVVATAGASKETLKVIIRKGVYFSIEAESGTLVSPMRIESGSAALGGKYITTPAGTGNTIFSKVEATYSYHAAAADSYYVWLRILVPSINTTANYGTFAGFDGTFKKPGIANLSAYKFEWIKSPSFALSAGSHQFILGHGNEQVQIDKIVITNCTATILPDVIAPNANITGFNMLHKALHPVLEMASSGKSINFQVYLNQGGSFSLHTYDVSGRKMWEYQKERCAAGLQQISLEKRFLKNGVYMTELANNSTRSAVKYSIVE